ncbi:MAG: hypothetical protein DRP65_01250 [Planctomycetota bacterium]|nr:MAG: hypothetical protein DRP65_01250 [Planctomycetota bacterium]
MIRAKKTASLFRWLLLAGWVSCLGLGIWWALAALWDEGAGIMGTPEVAFPVPLFPVIKEMGKLGYFLFVAIYLAFFFLSQWFFLCPGRIWKIKVQPQGRPMKRSAISAAFAVALLSVGLFFSLLDLLPGAAFEDGPPYFSCVYFSYHYVLILIPLALWCLWSVIFCIYWRQGDHYTWVGKVLRALIGGTILEFFVSVPIYVTRQEDCYCVRGSYTGLVFGATVLLWAFGPGVFLLFIKEKHRREKLLDFAQEQDQASKSGPN